MSATQYQTRAEAVVQSLRIVALRDGELEPGDFFAKLLATLVAQFPCRLVAIWGVNQQGIVERIAERNSNRTSLADPERSRKRIHDVFVTLTKPQAEVTVTTDATDDSLVTLHCPIVQRHRSTGVVELSIEANESEVAKTVVIELATIAGAYATRVTGPSHRSPDRHWVNFSLAVHGSLAVDEVAATAVNDGRSLTNADRVTLVARVGGKLKIVAVSGHEQIAANAEGLRGMVSVAELVCASGQFCCLDASLADLDSPLALAMSEHASRSGATTIEAYPLAKLSDDNRGGESDRQKPIGAMIFENFGGQPDSIDRDAIAYVVDHTATALHNALRYQRLVVSLPNRLLGKFFAPSDKRSPARLAMWVTVAASLMIFLGYLPTRYRIEARGTLVPSQRTYIYAPRDAIVAEILVAGNQRVERGDVLLRLESERLVDERLASEARLQERKQALAMLMVESGKLSRNTSDKASVRLQGSIAQAKLEIDSLKTRLEGIEREEARLVMTAPIAGVVATFDPQQLLQHRPVARGDRLIELIDARGLWNLELECPTHKFGQLDKSAENATLASPVEFVMASQPEQTFTGLLSRVGNRVVTNDAGDGYVPLEAKVNESNIALAGNIAGSAVTARVECGKKPLAYVLFGSIWDFLARHLW